jgi:transcription termination factor Rho
VIKFNKSAYEKKIALKKGCKEEAKEGAENEEAKDSEARETQELLL